MPKRFKRTNSSSSVKAPSSHLPNSWHLQHEAQLEEQQQQEQLKEQQPECCSVFPGTFFPLLPPHQLSFSLHDSSIVPPPCCIYSPPHTLFLLPLPASPSPPLRQPPPPSLLQFCLLKNWSNVLIEAPRRDGNFRAALQHRQERMHIHTRAHSQTRTQAAWQPINDLQSNAKEITAC